MKMAENDLLFALPVVAIGIHNILQRRNDHFAQELLSRLLEERETLPISV
jgi:hypothetical protein